MAGFDPFDDESLPGSDSVFTPQTDGQHDLAFAGKCGGHECKIPSYWLGVNVARAQGAATSSSVSGKMQEATCFMSSILTAEP